MVHDVAAIGVAGGTNQSPPPVRPVATRLPIRARKAVGRAF